MIIVVVMILVVVAAALLYFIIPLIILPAIATLLSHKEVTYVVHTYFVYMKTVNLEKVSHCHRVHNWTKQYVIEFLDVFAKFRRATISYLASVCLSVRPHGTTQVPMDGFS
jgi:hypothetical protein